MLVGKSDATALAKNPKDQAEGDAALGRLVREHSDMKRRTEMIAREVNAISEKLSSLGAALRIQNAQLVSPGRVASILAELPEDLTPAKIREMIAEYSAASAQLSAIKSELKPYGIVE